MKHFKPLIYIISIVVIIVICFGIISYINHTNYSNTSEKLKVSLITSDEYNKYSKEYDNGNDNYIKINKTDKLDGIVYNYGVIIPLQSWQSKDFDKIQNNAVYFVDDYRKILRSWDLDVVIGTINEEPDNYIRIGIKINSRDKNRISNPKDEIKLNSFSFRINEDEINSYIK